MVRIILIFIFFVSFANSESVKEKQEILDLKKEINQFYDTKEKEYQKKKQELEALSKKVESDKKSSQEILDKNKAVLDDIKGTMATKAAKVYSGMKPKIAAGIFNTMIEEGKIDDVFDIIVRLKEPKVTALMKFLTPKNASALTQMLKNYKPQEK